jgi:hypothetical protein
MAQDRAAPKGTTAAEPRRKWQRRPASRRLDLTPEQQAAAEAERRNHLRTSGLRIQLTEEERAEIDQRAKAQRVRVSDYAREVLLSPEKAPLPPPRDKEGIRKLAFELSKIGTNLNQLAKYANERRALPSQIDFDGMSDRIIAALEKVYGL